MSRIREAIQQFNIIGQPTNKYKTQVHMCQKILASMGAKGLLPVNDDMDDEKKQANTSKTTKKKKKIPLIWNGKSYAIVVGINEYDNSGWPLLDHAVADAKIMCKTLEKHGFEVIGKFYGKEVKGKEATKQNVLKKIADLKILLTRKDRFVFYFAGHGTEDYDGSLLMVDSDIAYRDGILTVSDFRNVVQDTKKAGHVLFILDCCHSGIFAQLLEVRDTTQILNPIWNKHINKDQDKFDKMMRRHRSVDVFATCLKDQSATDHESCTRTLCRGLNVEAFGDDVEYMHTSQLAHWVKCERINIDIDQLLICRRLGHGEFAFVLPDPSKKTKAQAKH